jgi:AAA15 family ATPase/GTPase
MNNGTLESFVVENFRLFEKIKINHLRRVNLFVGKNNAGKSALLEALLLYFSKLSPDVMIDTIPYQFIPTQGVSDNKTAALWDSISLTNLETKVIEGLKLIEPTISGIAFVKSEFSGGRIPLVKLEDMDEPIPLKNLGDGMSRLLQIILSLVTAKDGALLIDEFENGLYWDIQEDVWKVVFKLAEELNVQVFATTHSRDCIAGFQKAWAENEDKGAFLRLTKKDGNVTIKEYDLELLTDSLETNVEVR